MLRVQYEERGPVPRDLVRTIEVDPPALGPGQVLLEVLAAPINPSDLLMITGYYAILPPLPAGCGMEGVGRVVEWGPGVAAPPLGQMVLLPAGPGTWATHMVAEAEGLLPLPNDADPLQMSMLMVNPPTAALMLSEYVDLEPGDFVIQNAANSGVGSYLTQLAKIRGYRTVNVVRREAAVAAVRENGGEIALVDGDELPARVAEATGGANIRLGIDAVGGAASDRLAKCLGESATLVNYGVMSGQACWISPRSLIFRDLRVRGFWRTQWARQASPERQAAVLGELAGLIAEGKLWTKVAATFKLSEIKDAVAVAGRGERDGKILLTPSG